MMARLFGGNCALLGAAASVLLVSTGCGQAFTATTGTGGGGTSSGGGGTGGTAAGGTGGTGGSTTSTGTGTMGVCVDGETEPCYTGPPKTQHVGLCKDGSHTCAKGMWGDCTGDTTPAAEKCDGKDNNCNKAIDEGCDCTAGAKQPCYDGPDGTEGVGTCTGGMQTCKADGTWGDCMGEHKPGAEDCTNPNVDDDCNGTKDDIPGLGNSCSTGMPGPCSPGVNQCMGTAFVCHTDVKPATEICDNVDNDCNGMVDNNVQPMQCMVGNVTMCPGKQFCNKGNFSPCVPSGQGILFFDSFSSQDGGGNWEFQGEWAIGPTAMGPSAMVGNPDPKDDHTPTDDNKVAGIVLGNNGSTAPHARQYLTLKKTIAAQNASGPLYLGFWRWLNTTLGYDDIVEVSSNGGNNWTTVWSNLPPNADVQDDEWVLQKIDISNAKSDQLLVRFGHGVLGGGPLAQTVSSWNIDDVIIGTCIPE